MGRIESRGVRHELIAALIQFHDQALELIGLVNQRCDEPRESIGEEFHQIRRHPFIVVFGPRLVQIREKLRCEPMGHGHGAEGGARSHGELPPVAQRRVQFDFRQIAGGIDHAGDSVAV